MLRDPPCVVSSALICSETPLVSAQEIAAARARVCHLLHAVDTARDASARPESYEAEKAADNPGNDAGLRLGFGRHVRLAVRAGHGDRSVTKAGSRHILNLSHNLDRTLRLLRWWV